MKNIIEETYDGNKCPIIERDYNAYVFPENYNPDNMEDQVESIIECYENRCKIKVWDKTD